ncbi:hypothetical protein Lal_00019787 [Lupinus albus]|nr:hypothetical protein Lal_00019787 [Lupinus albus]
MAGAQHYITVTRPELSYSVSEVCQFLSQPQEEHWKPIKRLLRYLRGTLNHGLLFRPAPDHLTLGLYAYCNDCRHITGALLSRNPVMHSNTKHIELDNFFGYGRESSTSSFVECVPSEHQVVDILTKAMSTTRSVTHKD